MKGDLPRLLSEGKFFVGRTPLDQHPVVSSWCERNPPKEHYCFWTCQKFKQENPLTGIYYEGFSFSLWEGDYIQLLNHAWIVIAGKVFDLNNQVKPGLIECSYLGLPFKKIEKVPEQPALKFNRIRGWLPECIELAQLIETSI